MIIEHEVGMGSFEENGSSKRGEKKNKMDTTLK